MKLLKDEGTHTLTMTSRSRVVIGIKIRPNQNTGVVKIMWWMPLNTAPTRTSGQILLKMIKKSIIESNFSTKKKSAWEPKKAHNGLRESLVQRLIFFNLKNSLITSLNNGIPVNQHKDEPQGDWSPNGTMSQPCPWIGN